MTSEEMLRINKHSALQMLTEARWLLIDARPLADRQLPGCLAAGGRDNTPARGEKTRVFRFANCAGAIP